MKALQNPPRVFPSVKASRESTFATPSLSSRHSSSGKVWEVNFVNKATAHGKFEGRVG